MKDNNWQERFDTNYVLLGDKEYPFKAIPKDLKEDIKQFISQLLTTQREEIKKELAEKIPEYFIQWRQEIDNTYAKKKPAVLVSFPVWLSEFLSKE